MKQSVQKVIATSLAAVMSLSMLSVTAFAQEAVVTSAESTNATQATAQTQSLGWVVYLKSKNSDYYNKTSSTLSTVEVISNTEVYENTISLALRDDPKNSDNTLALTDLTFTVTGLSATTQVEEKIMNGTLHDVVTVTPTDDVPFGVLHVTCDQHPELFAQTIVYAHGDFVAVTWNDYSKSAYNEQHQIVAVAPKEISMDYDYHKIPSEAALSCYSIAVYTPNEWGGFAPSYTATHKITGSSIVADVGLAMRPVANGKSTVTMSNSGKTFSVAFNVINYGTEKEETVRGDVTGDEKISISDVMKILQHMSGRITLTEAQTSVGDINNDGTLTISDVMKILQYMSGRISSL